MPARVCPAQCARHGPSARNSAHIDCPHRGLRMTIEGIERAKKNGAYCIGISDSMLSPLARFSDELLIVPINSLSFAASYVAPLALIDLITAGVGSLRRKQVVDRLKEADQEQRHGYRWYQTES